MKERKLFPMKKFVALLLAAMMLISCVSVFAESPEQTDLIDLIDPPEFFEKVEDPEKVEKLLEELTDLKDKLDEETLDELAEIFGEDEYEVAEIIILKITAAGNGEPVKVTFKFPTNFAGKTVAVLFDLETEQLVLPAVANDNGTVTVEFQPDVLQKLADFCAANGSVAALFLIKK